MDAFDKGFLIGLVCVLFAMVLCTSICFYQQEVEVFVEGYDVMNVDCIAKDEYRMGICNDSNADTIIITAKEYAQYQVGDTIAVEVTLYENAFGEITKEYKIMDKIEG